MDDLTCLFIKAHHSLNDRTHIIIHVATYLNMLLNKTFGQYHKPECSSLLRNMLCSLKD